MNTEKITDPSQLSYSWGEMAELTHEKQVDTFGWCSCEGAEDSEHPYSDCPPSGITYNKPMTETMSLIKEIQFLAFVGKQADAGAEERRKILRKIDKISSAYILANEGK